MKVGIVLLVRTIQVHQAHRRRNGQEDQDQHYKGERAERESPSVGRCHIVQGGHVGDRTGKQADNRLTYDRPAEGWYDYLFDTMFTPSPKHFGANHLTVITFNFERSFEGTLVLSLMSNYGITEQQAIELA
jgi:hypothetical protein